MKKRLFTLLLAVLLCAALALPVFAADEGHPLRLVDEIGLLSPQENARILTRLNTLSNENDFDIVIVLMSADEVGSDTKGYADWYYESHGYGMGSDGESGILLLIAPDGNRVNYAYTTYGKDSRPFDDDALDRLDDAFLPDLRERDYAASCLAFAEKSAEIAQEGGIPVVTWIILSLIVGMLLSFLIPMSVLKGQLKSVRAQCAASSYVRDGSMQLRQERDIFLYRNVTRTERPKNNGSSGGGGDSSHSTGGRSGSV